MNFKAPGTFCEQHGLMHWYPGIMETRNPGILESRQPAVTLAWHHWHPGVRRYRRIEYLTDVGSTGVGFIFYSPDIQ